MKVQGFKRGLFGMVLAAAMVAPIHLSGHVSLNYAQASAAENGMAKIQLILKKLRGSMSSMKDFDELETAGMPKRDVDRMRRAMTQKIKQLTDEAVQSIHDL